MVRVIVSSTRWAMKRAGWSSILAAVVLLAVGVIAEAQQPKVYYVGLLTVGSPGPLIKGLRDGLKEAGYIEGQNLVLDIQAIENYDQIRPIAKAYAEKKFDAIVTSGSTSTLIAKEITQKIPIVFIGANDPIVSGLVKSVAHPEANVTGVASATDVEIQGKRLEVFKEAVPTLRRVVVLYNARGENPVHAKGLALIQKVAPNLGLNWLKNLSRWLLILRQRSPRFLKLLRMVCSFSARPYLGILSRRSLLSQ
jgi:putative ABC transport system substrate-binding protein